MGHDVEPYLEAATAAKRSFTHEILMLQDLLRAGWAGMSAENRQAFLVHEDTRGTHAAGLCEDVDDVEPLGNLEAYIKAARAHGEDSEEPDHEAGDLQDYLRHMAKVMSPAEFATFEGTEAASSLLAAAPPGPRS